MVSITFVSENLKIYIHFLYSVTASDDSEIYFIDVIVLISWVDTQTQIRMAVGSITFNARGLMRGQYVCLMPIS